MRGVPGEHHFFLPTVSLNFHLARSKAMALDMAPTGKTNG